MEFKEWLLNKKKYSSRSTQDVFSRLKRVKNILNIDTIDTKTEEKLQRSKEFLELSCSVKSQMRIAVRTYIEYKGENHD